MEGPVGDGQTAKKQGLSKRKEYGGMTMAGGLVTSMIAIAVGAILDFGVTASPDQHGFNLHNVGVILMIVGVVGAILSLIGLIASGGPRRRHTTIDDGSGNVVRRDDTYI